MENSYKILVVDDQKDYRETSRILLEEAGYIVNDVDSTSEALKVLEKEYHPIVVTDVNMPGKNGIELLQEIKKKYKEKIEVIVITGYGSVGSAVEAMKMGAFSYCIKSGNPEELLLDIRRAKKLINLEANVKNENNRFVSKVFMNQTKSEKMKNVIEKIEQISMSSSSILLLGESGVGKEIFAKMIHKRSERHSRSFVPINCQAISDSLLESELFGHEKGSFTGALTKRIGRFEEASGGTIFLDEIGEMNLDTQVKLLRVLDSKKIERLGSNKSIDVDFRLISATNKNIEKAIKASEFRDDLFYRINTFIIEIPPLRERREDIEGMIEFFVNHYRCEMKKDTMKIDPKTMEYLLSYDYPGNVRELKNIVERLVVLSKDGILKFESAYENKKEKSLVNKEVKPFKVARSEFERNYIMNILKITDNNITKAATLMDLSRRQLFNKLVEYDIKK